MSSQGAELKVGTLVLFPTRPTSQADRDAKSLVEYKVKTGNVQVIRAYCSIAMTREGSGLRQYLEEAGTLVPVPKSSIHQPNSLWVPQLIATELYNADAGDNVEALLERVKPVRKSGGVANSALRPTAQEHFESLGVTRDLYPPERVTLVDDVATIGRTLIGCAKRLHVEFPGIEVQAFALARSVRHTSIQHVKYMLRPAISTYSMNANGFITHDGPH